MSRSCDWRVGRQIRPPVINPVSLSSTQLFFDPTDLCFSEIGIRPRLQIPSLFLMAQNLQLTLLFDVLQLISEGAHLHPEFFLFRIYACCQSSVTIMPFTAEPND